MPAKARQSSRAAKATSQSKAKAGAKARAKSRPSASAPEALHAPERPPPSPRSQAALIIQACTKSLLARQLLIELEEVDRQHQAELAEAIRATNLAVLLAERRKAEAEREKDIEKRRKKKELAEDTKRMLAAAFEGDAEQVKAFVAKGLPVDASLNGVTALSEAAGGGSRHVAKLMLEIKADPNSRGEFRRTPLWRAAYAGHLEVVHELLEGGGDPRLYTEQGEAPADVASTDEVLEQLKAWDVSLTDELVEEFEEWREGVRLQEVVRQAETMRSVDQEFEAARAANVAAQSRLARAKAALRRRVEEYDDLVIEGRGEDPLRRARQVCEVAESELSAAEDAAFRAQSRFDAARVQRFAVAEAAGVSPDDGTAARREVRVRDLNDILIRDIGDRIASSEKWPLVLDPSDCAAKLLQYAGCAVLNFWRPGDLSAEKVRVALLSMIRGGGVLAIDLFAVGAGIDKELLAEPFENVRPGLFKELLDRSILRARGNDVWPSFHGLVDKARDGKRFSVEQFDEERIGRFKVAVITSTYFPHNDLADLFDVIHVLPGDGE
mmetsp:Transcript_18153/g.31853  ORF Transcript_18153/g.31853 Transcript_18153/m.31853 type:complete len:553 (+) Transcript_18153:30-1688(+)